MSCIVIWYNNRAISRNWLNIFNTDDMKLEELKIIDVIKMPLFAEQVKTCLDDLRKTRRELEAKGAQFKRTAMDRLAERKALEPSNLAELYAKVVDKELNPSEWSSELRTFIKGIGDAAFYRTMQLLKAEEEYHAKNSEQNEKDS